MKHTEKAKEVIEKLGYVHNRIRGTIKGSSIDMAWPSTIP